MLSPVRFKRASRMGERSQRFRLTGNRLDARKLFRDALGATRGVLVSDRLITPRQVCAWLSVSRSTLYRLQRTPDFPKRIIISTNRRGFRFAEIEYWIESRRAR